MEETLKYIHNSYRFSRLRQTTTLLILIYIVNTTAVDDPGALLLTWINSNPRMDT